MGSHFQGDIFLPHNVTKDIVFGLLNEVLWCSCICAALSPFVAFTWLPTLRACVCLPFASSIILQQAGLLIVVLHLWKKRLTGIIAGQCQPLNETL